MSGKTLREILFELVDRLGIKHSKPSSPGFAVDARGMPMFPSFAQREPVVECGRFLFTTVGNPGFGEPKAGKSATLGVEIREFEGPME
ncbi:hypothetical protein RZS28_00630 [Methylocapsa polymorpha]|uniref:Uncharacterized protein n=1 Tax=Methylocapsa polymorpha TaxID=3080828 RepID=A0ABZ0HSS5_9HYPH|nr:hypothetical protein RZS28_00630 [Methylocapsa sp. RX1]